jgi:hypothetical protein
LLALLLLRVRHLLAVSAASALAEVGAGHSELEALAVALLAARLLAGAALPVLQLVLVLSHLDFKGLGVSFQDLVLCLLNHISAIVGVAAVLAAAVDAANQASCKALAVELQALGLRASALLSWLSRCLLLLLTLQLQGFRVCLGLRLGLLFDSLGTLADLSGDLGLSSGAYLHFTLGHHLRALPLVALLLFSSLQLRAWRALPSIVLVDELLKETDLLDLSLDFATLLALSG